MVHPIEIILRAKETRAQSDRAMALLLDQSVIKSARLLAEANQLQLEAAGFLNRKAMQCQASIN